MKDKSRCEGEGCLTNCQVVINLQLLQLLQISCFSPISEFICQVLSLWGGLPIRHEICKHALLLFSLHTCPHVVVVTARGEYSSLNSNCQLYHIFSIFCSSLFLFCILLRGERGSSPRDSGCNIHPWVCVERRVRPPNNTPMNLCWEETYVPPSQGQRQDCDAMD